MWEHGELHPGGLLSRRRSLLSYVLFGLKDKNYCQPDQEMVLRRRPCSFWRGGGSRMRQCGITVITVSSRRCVVGDGCETRITYLWFRGLEDLKPAPSRKWELAWVASTTLALMFPSAHFLQNSSQLSIQKRFLSLLGGIASHKRRLIAFSVHGNQITALSTRYHALLLLLPTRYHAFPNHVNPSTNRIRLG